MDGGVAHPLSWGCRGRVQNNAGDGEEGGAAMSVLRVPPAKPCVCGMPFRASQERPPGHTRHGECTTTERQGPLQYCREAHACSGSRGHGKRAGLKTQATPGPRK